jgi:hypothetical protein
MIAYGYIQNNISNLLEISKSGNHFYNFKGLNFLCKMNPKNSKIVFIFHGARTNKDEVIFRGFDYQIEGTDIICISDYLISIYEDYTVNWTLPTKKHNTDIIYYEIISTLLQKKYQKVIFTGTSAGGYPSIKFACYFNAFALIANSQIYLEKYSRFQVFKKMLESYGDAVIYENKEIEKIIQNNKPKKIIIYNNKDDSTYERDIVPFLEFLKNKNLIHYFDFHIFSWTGPIPEGKTHHHIQFPGNKKHLEILKNASL